MRLAKTRAAIVLCSAALIGLTGSADARPAHHDHHHRKARAPIASPSGSGAFDGRYAFMRWDSRRQAHKRAHGTHHSMHHRRHRVAAVAKPVFSGTGSSDLVAEARKFLGTNPTGWKHVWCGKFMDMVLRRTGHKGGGNLALGYLHYGHRVSGPQVGAIAVMRRRGGGHVGVVAGIDANGNPIIVSGNHNHKVAESVYPRRRIVAYVEPNN